ncbi:MAG: glycosyltransferase involved in cell wall biosynthesis [Psychromonas sp.]|jgi:glycosyltransferase involved in cell wall biosynthesis|uniref:glycosyltransferase family 4 protein n=1 Tax=Psychromonas sp. TaxID=1884585 RepID=UPI0039E328E0
MKVIFVSNLYPSEKEPYKGSFVKNIYNEFSNLGTDVCLIRLEHFGLSKWLKIASFLSFYIKSFFAALFSKNGDVFYIHYTSHSSLGVLFASLFKKINIVANVHGSDIIPEISNGKILASIKRYISKMILSRSDYVISPSGYFKETLHKEYNIDLSTIFVSPSGGVNNSIFEPQKNSFDPQNITFGYVGRLEEDKGIFDLIDCYIVLSAINPNINLIIVGSGSAHARVQNITRHQPTIELYRGRSQPELAGIYNSIDYLVFPSCRKSESLGLVPIEAMMCGTPVISSRIGATGDYIKDELKDLSFDSGNKEQLLECMKKAISLDKIYYNELASLSQKIANEFKSDKVISDLLNFFKNKFNTLDK